MNKLQKVLYSLASDRAWLSGSHSGLISRTKYIPAKYYALFSQPGSINYLGRKFRYDNKNTPVTLQSYPAEIQRLNQWVDFSEPTNVLDVGANIGQFSFTLNAVHPGTNVFAFEPNPSAYSILSKNIENIGNIHQYNYALGPPGKMNFYFVQGASAKGSFIETNASINLGNVKTDKLEVELVELDGATCDQLGIPEKFDLVKIDVEGFEYEVLNAIRHIDTRFMYIEFSMARAHKYSFYELLDRISDYFGLADVLYCDQIDLLDDERTIGNLLVKCGS
ncbi:FkbM family methyltransferase [Pseudomonadota bacterium]